jgi:succinate dehydrogenase/fumarate reductase flavoprotein subunit
MKTINTDILIIGGGLAGLAAAIEAKKDDNTVTIVCKSLAGRSGNTLVAGSAMASAQADNGDSAELLYRDVIKSSQGINDDAMAEYFAVHSSEVLQKLSGYDVVFRRVGDRYLTKRPPGHSLPRSFPVDISKVPYHNRGLSISIPLLNQAIKRDVNIINNTMVYKLQKSNGKISGALAINKKTNEIIRFVTGVVVIAAGGGGNIFSKTNNTADVTGDSYCLALEAGAELRDMEYVQYYPTMMFRPLKVTISNPLFGEGAVLKNADGCEFMQSYSDAGNMATRDSMALAVYSEIMEGRGNPDYVYVDCSKIPGDIIDNKFAEFKGLLARKNIDVKKDYMPVSPAAHFYLGGIKVDSNCQTGVPGLLACGEAVWGVHGANRLSGNALSEAVVFGTLAGRQAAQMAAEAARQDTQQQRVDHPGLCIQRDGQYDISDIRSKLRRTMWQNAAVIRDESRLMHAGEEIKTLKERLESCRINGLSDNIRYNETKNLILLSEMLVKGALARRESRGAHYRQDYPDRDDRYLGNFVYTIKDGRVVMEFVHK